MNEQDISVSQAETEKKMRTPCRKKMPFSKRFSAKRVAVMSLFIALSYAVSLLEIPLPLFGASFLKLDFGNVFIVLLSFLLGPLEGIIACFVKEGLRCFSSSSLCSGELANFIITTAYMIIPSVLYCYKKNIKIVLITLAVGCVLATGVALLFNRILIFPVYAYLFGGSIFGLTVAQAFSAFWLGILLFNIIKTVSVSVLVLLLYKRLSNFLKKWEI